MTATRTLAARVDASPATLGLAVGDVALIALFVFLGEVRHYGLAEAPARTPETLAPFLVGWVLAAFLAGVYTVPARTDVRLAAGLTAAAWIGAAAVGLALRATSLFQGGSPLAFALVAFAVGLALLVPWRTLVAFLAAR